MSSNAGYALVNVNLFPPPNTRINEFMLGNITAEMRGETQMKDEKEGKKKKKESKRSMMIRKIFRMRDDEASTIPRVMQRRARNFV